MLHIEGKCTSRGPRIIEVNARLGGGRVADNVKAVWDFAQIASDERTRVELDIDVAVGAGVHGPEDVFATVLAEVSVIGKDLRHARAVAAAVVHDPRVVSAATSA